MHWVRPAIAVDARRFGRRFPADEKAPVPNSSVVEDLRLFAITFAAGFLFISLIIA